MSELTVHVNGLSEVISDDFGSTAEEFIGEMWDTVDPSRFELYRVPEEGRAIAREQLCGEPLVVDDGDEFIIIPKYVTDS